MKKSFQFVGLPLTLGITQVMAVGPTHLAPVIAQEAAAGGGIEALEDPRYWQDLCHLQVQSGLVDDAQMSCEQAIALDPNNEIAWRDYSSLLLTLEQYPKVLSAAGQLLIQNERNSQAMTHQCLAYLGLNQLEPALDACNNALLTNSFWGEMSPVLPLQARGQILTERGQHNQALIAYGQALQIEPDNALTLAYRCQTLVNLEQYDYAEVACNKAIANNGRQPPESPPAIAFASLGEINTQQGNQAMTAWVNNPAVAKHYETAIDYYNEAIARYDEAITLAPENASYLLQQGWLFEKTDNLVAATLTYTQYVSLVPESSQGLVAQCALYNQQFQYDLAKAACEQAIAGNGDWTQALGPAEAWRGLAQATASLGDYEAALPIIDRAIALDSDLLAAQSDRVVILWYLTRYDDAIAAAQNIVEETPTAQNRAVIANTLATLGRLYSQNGNIPSAITAYQEALELDDQNAETFINLSAALLRTGNPTQYEVALDMAKEATNLAPFLLQGWQNMAIAQEKLGRTLGAQITRERIEQLEQSQQ